MFSAKGNIRRAANYQFNLGEIYENDLGEPRSALEAYDTAADWYLSDQAEATANKAHLKVADLAAISEQYQRAITKFEDVASRSLQNNLTRFSAKDYFFKAGICRLASGVRKLLLFFSVIICSK
jgi:alpha-soluble NSF attachment protein